MTTPEQIIQDREKLDKIIQGSEICHLACCLDGRPYVIPIAFGYDGRAIYIHTSRAGKKIQAFTQNPQVCLAFESKIELLADLDQACEWSFGYTSVIAEGKIEELVSAQDKATGLNQIMLHYSGRIWDLPPANINSTRVWKINLDEITGKQSDPY